MAIEIFNREQFEQALPVNKNAGLAMWTYAGLQNGEHTYIVAGYSALAQIRVRSSINSSGVSADTGEDSIRCWLECPKTAAPLAKKLAAYITRVPGWQMRLKAALHELYKLSMLVRPCPNPQCACTTRICTAKTEKNAGRMFRSCPNCNYFDWLQDSAYVPAPKPKTKKQRKSA